MSKVLAVVVLILMIVGIGVCFLPLSKQVPIVQWLSSKSEQTIFQSSFQEQTNLTRQYEQKVSQKVAEALGKVVGGNRVQVSVQAQLEFSDETIKETKETRTSETEVKVHHVSGRVKNLSVTVVIDGVMVDNRRGKSIYQPRSQTEMKQYEDIVKSVVGFDANRGDTVVVQNIPFIDNAMMIFGLPLSVIGSWMITGLWGILLLSLIFGILWPYLRRLTQDPKQTSSQESILKKAVALCYQNPDRAAGVLKRWVHYGANRPNPRHYSLAEQAGIVILAVGDQVSRVLAESLSETDIRKMGQIIARLGKVASRDIQMALSKFIADYQMPSAVYGTQTRLKELLQKTVSNSQGLYSEISIDSMGKTVWEVLGQMDIHQLVEWLAHQKLEDVAIVLYHLPPTLSGKVMALLPQEMGTRAVIHLSHLKQVRSDIMEKMTRDVATEVMEMLSQSKTMSGVDKVASIFKTMSDQEKEKWISSVSKEDKVEGANLSARLKGWNDVMTLSADKMSRLLGYVDVNVLARALSIVPESKRILFIPYIPADIYEGMCRKFAALSAHVKEAEQAQNLIVKTAQQLKLF